MKAYLRCRTDDAFASFASSRSLVARGSWGTAPSVFWYGAPGGTRGPLGKGGAAKRWRVAYPIGIATRHGAKPATTHTSKRNASAASGAHHAFAKDSAPPLGEKKLSAVNPSGSFHSPPPFTQGRLSPPGAHKPALKSHNKSQLHLPNKIHHLCKFRPTFSYIVNLP